MDAEQTDDVPFAGRDLMSRAVAAVMLVAVAAEVLAEVDFVRRRMRRSVSAWWAGIERRERRSISSAEFAYLTHFFARHQAATRRPQSRGVVPPWGDHPRPRFLTLSLASRRP